jgi:hypothetical protein
MKAILCNNNPSHTYYQLLVSLLAEECDTCRWISESRPLRSPVHTRATTIHTHHTTSITARGQYFALTVNPIREQTTNGVRARAILAVVRNRFVVRPITQGWWVFGPMREHGTSLMFSGIRPNEGEAAPEGRPSCDCNYISNSRVIYNKLGQVLMSNTFLEIYW